MPANLFRILAVLLAASSLASAQEGRRFEKRWIASVAALAAVNVLDAYTSRNMGEANPFLRGSNGSFDGSRGVAVKFAATGGFLAVQYLLLRKRPNPGMNRTFTITNAALAGVVGAVAIHNHTLNSTTTEPVRPALPAYLVNPSH